VPAEEGGQGVHEGGQGPYQETQAVKVDLPNGWRPRKYQLPLWRYLANGGKRGVAVWHRRAGKDDLALHWTAVAAHLRPATYWHMLPQYAQGRKAVWEAVNPHTGVRRIDEAFPPALRKRTDNQTMTIELKNGSMWHVVGSDNYNSLVGSPPAGVVLSEWAIADPAAWGYLRPILDENEGWALFIYTPRGRNHGWDTYQFALGHDGWYAERLSARDTGVFTEDQLQAALAEYQSIYTPDIGEMLFKQEYLCSFEGGVLGAYYASIIDELEEKGRITDVPYDSAMQVHTWWDLGMADSTAIWFVQHGPFETRVIDYYENHGVGLEHYVKVLQEKGYVYGQHVAPHDIEVRELGSGKSRKEVALSLGIRFDVAPRMQVIDGINAVRQLLPRCYFDREKTQKGLDALRQYRTSYDEKLRVFRKTPLHDWTSHAADAFRYGAITRAPANPQELKDAEVYVMPQIDAGGWML